MGTWGNEPKDNDGTCDMWGTVCDAINAVAAMGLWAGDTQEQFERAGLVQLLLEKGVHVRRSTVEQSAYALRDALKDKEWLAHWKNPKVATKTIERIASAMDQLLKVKKIGAKLLGSRRRQFSRISTEVLAWPGWPAPDRGRSWTGRRLR